MNKVDKEALLDIHTSIMDLISEAKKLLKLEAPKAIYDRAEASWISDIETALGSGSYIDAYNSTFWMTLEELGVLTIDGRVAELKDDPEDTTLQLESFANEGGISLDKEQENDNEGDDFIEAVYVVDESKNGNRRIESSTDGVVEEFIQQVEASKPSTQQIPNLDFGMYGCWYGE
jgi:hypothetical protein